MKTLLKRNSEQGAMLVGTLIIAAIMGSVIVAVTAMVIQEHRMLSRSTTWNATLPIAEAGIEEAMSHRSPGRYGFAQCEWLDFERNELCPQPQPHGRSILCVNFTSHPTSYHLHRPGLVRFGEPIHRTPHSGQYPRSQLFHGRGQR